MSGKDDPTSDQRKSISKQNELNNQQVTAVATGETQQEAKNELLDVNAIIAEANKIIPERKTAKNEDVNVNESIDNKNTKGWVKFEEDDASTPTAIDNLEKVEKNSGKGSSDVTPAVLTTETVHISINNKIPPSPSQIMNTTGPAIIDIPISPAASAAAAAASANSGLRTIELSTGRVREGFANGDVIVTLLPVNTKWPWITPAKFRPELVPEELMAQGLTLTVEEYVHAMETLVNDFRFTLYNICYKRILCAWIIFAFTILLAILFCGLTGITLFSLGVGWLFLNAAAIFLCMWMKLRLSRGLEHCMASVNKQLLRHKIILALDDRGKISCHKVNLCFIYYEPAQCISFLNEFLERNEENGTAIERGWEQRLDISAADIVIQGANTTRLSRKQERGTLLLLRYASRWGNEVIRGLADVSVIEPARHCAKFICPCQYIERHLSCKPRGKSKIFHCCYWVKASERYD